MKGVFYASLAVLMASIAIPATALSDNKGGKPLYTVKDGYKVDADTMEGFRTWRAAACDRCHGPNQEGMVGPSLIDGLKVLTEDQFKATVLEGRLAKGMPSFGSNKKVSENIDELYAYLKGRSDGAITRAKVVEMEK
jgi:mono/diheme cytochrome c family protein